MKGSNAIKKRLKMVLIVFLILVLLFISGVIVYWRYGSELRLPEGIRVPESLAPEWGKAMISYSVKSAPDMFKSLYFMPGGEVYLVTEDVSQKEDEIEKTHGTSSRNTKETCILIGKLSYEDRKQLTEFVSEIDHGADKYDMWRNNIHNVPGSSKVELKQEESKQEEPKQEELEQEEPKQEEPESFDDIISNTRERIPYQVWNKRDALIVFFRFHDYTFTSEVWIEYLLCDESVIDVWKFTKNTWFFERYIQYVSSGEE